LECVLYYWLISSKYWR